MVIVVVGHPRVTGQAPPFRPLDETYTAARVVRRAGTEAMLSARVRQQDVETGMGAEKLAALKVEAGQILQLTILPNNEYACDSTVVELNLKPIALAIRTMPPVSADATMRCASVTASIAPRRSPSVKRPLARFSWAAGSGPPMSPTRSPANFSSSDWMSNLARASRDGMMSGVSIERDKSIARRISRD